MISPTVSGLQQSLIEPLIWKECPHIFRLNYSLTSTIDWYILSQSRNTGSFFIPHWACRELFTWSLTNIVLLSDDIHSGQPHNQKGFLQAEQKTQKNIWPFPCYLEETGGHQSHYCSDVLHIWISQSALWEIYQSLWDFIKFFDWSSYQNEISQLLLALRIYLHACCSI